MDVDGSVVIDLAGLDALIHRLADLGYDTRGPVVRDGAIMPGTVRDVTDLPAGYHDEQRPGEYALTKGTDTALFGWAVGPGSWKAEFFPPTEVVWRASVEPGATPDDPPAADAHRPLAVIGARPCELAALEVLDRVLDHGPVPDPGYAQRRDGTFVVVADCGTPSASCFCSSMGTGPGAERGFDLALTELAGDDGHRFVLRVGSARGAEVMAGLPCTAASTGDLEDREQVLAAANEQLERTKRLDTEGLPELLAANLDHPRWNEVAERCLACGNCTLVCPTCFCSDVRDTTDLSGEVTRQRRWSSCFDLDHSYLHGGPVRASTSSRYRQWMTHKLSTWWDQFGTSGCVGCGRCITWCPVGIDIREEAAAIRAGASGP